MAIWALVVVAIALLLGAAAFVGSYLGKRVSAAAVVQSPVPPHRPNERLGDDLQDCVELGDRVTRDSEVVASLLAAESPAIPPELMGAMRQLLDTTKTLAGRLQKVENSTSPNRRGDSPQGSSRSAFTLSAPESPKSNEKRSTPAPVVQASPQVDEDNEEEGNDAESRRFPRSPCHGSLQATIYPPPSDPGGEPIRCSVLTRNLSCGGVGIAHSEKLVQKQVLVLEAVGRLLVAEVRWCRQLDDKFFIAGCRLIKTAE